jgi:hypothetical protein
MTTLFAILITCAVVGVLTWAICLIPMPNPIRQVIVAVAVICTVVYCLQRLGLIGNVGLPGLDR